MICGCRHAPGPPAARRSLFESKRAKEDGGERQGSERVIPQRSRQGLACSAKAALTFRRQLGFRRRARRRRAPKFGKPNLKGRGAAALLCCAEGESRRGLGWARDCDWAWAWACFTHTLHHAEHHPSGVHQHQHQHQHFNQVRRMEGAWQWVRIQLKG